MGTSSSTSTRSPLSSSPSSRPSRFARKQASWLLSAFSLLPFENVNASKSVRQANSREQRTRDATTQQTGKTRERERVKLATTTKTRCHGAWSTSHMMEHEIRRGEGHAWGHEDEEGGPKPNKAHHFGGL